MRKCFALAFTLTLTFQALGQYQYNWTPGTQSIYESITSLRIPEARALISQEKKANATNLIYPLLESYADFYQLFLNENSAEFKLAYPAFEQRIQLLEAGPKASPYHLYSIALAHLHKSLIAIRFNKNFEAALDFRKAFLLFKENKRAYPKFSPNDVYLGLMTTVIGTIPKGYQWIANILGMTGKITDGNALVLKYINSKDPLSNLCRNEALFVYPYLIMNFEGNKKKTFDFIEKTDYDYNNNHLHAYMATNLYLNNQQSQKALQIASNINPANSYLDLPFWQLEMGYAYLNDLKLDAAKAALQNFISRFKGQFYLKDAYEKLSWIAYIQGDQTKANAYRNNVLSKGNDITDADKQALQNAKKGTWPHPILLRARLLSDGGYQQQALAILAGKTSKDFDKDADKTEFAYRLGRIYDLAGQPDQAIQFYKSAIEKGTNQLEYFAARAALQIGLIYEQKGNPTLAISFFNTCLEMKNHAFKNSLDQKAKTGIQRCLRK
ncbi:MAG: tetratricopeptide repeat protein [Sediminibacterium sp.]